MTHGVYERCWDSTEMEPSGNPVIAWCDACTEEARQHAQKAEEMVRAVIDAPRTYDASSRAAAELMRWLMRDRYRRVEQLNEKLEAARMENRHLREAHGNLTSKFVIDCGDIIETYCEEFGYDGLFNADGECACRVGEIDPADCFSSECIPGVEAKCDCGEHDFHIVRKENR